MKFISKFKKGTPKDIYEFEGKLKSIKKDKVDFTFYPYSSFSNISHLNKLLKPTNKDFVSYIKRRKILDIGAADGDTSFLSEYLGAKSVDVIEYPLTNYNGVRGIKYIKKRLNSKINIHEFDLDSENWPKLNKYDFAYFLGIMYHLKNPVYILEKLSHIINTMVISSRVFDQLDIGGRKVNVANTNICYFWKPGEVNKDYSNWWCFTDKSIRLILERSGWKVITSTRVDKFKNKSLPTGMKYDGRQFLLVNSTR